MDQVEFIPLKCFEDDRGSVLHFIKNNDPFFSAFGECYFSWINPGYVKGWYCHTSLISYFTSPTTNLKVVLFDKDNAIKLIDINKDNYGLIKVPPGVWYSFQSTGTKPALIVNILSGLYDPAECRKLPLFTSDIPYRWIEVSIIIPTFNRSKLIVNTLQSIFSQSYKNYEVIVISNGSTDDTEEVLKSFKDERLKYIFQHGSGSPASPRNTGIKASKGRFIAFCDDDDIWLPDKLEKQVKFLQENLNYDICCTKMKCFADGIEWIPNKPPEQIDSLSNEKPPEQIDSLSNEKPPEQIDSLSNEKPPEQIDSLSLLYKNSIPLSSIMVRRNILNDDELFDEDKKIFGAEDYELILRLSTKSKIFCIQEFLTLYYSGSVRFSNLTATTPFKRNLKYLYRLYSVYRKLVNKGFFEWSEIFVPLCVNIFSVLKIIIYESVISFKKKFRFVN